MPLVKDVSHDEGVIELRAAMGENRWVSKETRLHFLHVQWPDFPHFRFQLDTVEPAAVPRE